MVSTALQSADLAKLRLISAAKVHETGAGLPKSPIRSRGAASPVQCESFARPTRESSLPEWMVQLFVVPQLDPDPKSDSSHRNSGSEKLTLCTRSLPAPIPFLEREVTGF